MAKVRLDLTQFKASGVYTLEYDASESIILNSQIVRLIIGFSRKGPFNAPVYLPDKKTAVRVFGNVDEFLERRGSFFHRSLMTALEYGPVFGLNLMKLNNDPAFGDKVPYQSFSLATTEKNGKKVNALLASFYNKERFWYPDQEYLLGNVNSDSSPNKGKLFNIVNLGQNPVSIIVRKSKVLGMNVIAREWFGAGKVPSYINEWDFISDYFVDLIIVQGNWTDYQQLSIDPVYSKYFNTRGLIKAKMNDFFADESVNVLASFTGSVIPDLTDGNGINHSIDTIINQQIAATGVFVAIDRKSLENYDPLSNDDDNDNYSAVDMIGHNFANPDRVNPEVIDFLSYKTAIQKEISFLTENTFTEEEVDVSKLTISTTSIYKNNLTYLNNVIVIDKPNTNVETDPSLRKYLTLKNLLVAKQSLIELKNGKYGSIESVWEENNVLKILWSHPNKKYDLAKYFELNNIELNNGTIIINKNSITWNAAYDNINVIGKDLLIKYKNNNYYYKIKNATSDTNTIRFTIENYENYIGELELINTNKDIYKVYVQGTGDEIQVNIGNTTINLEGFEIDTTKDLKFIINPDKCEYTNGTFIAYKGHKLYEYFIAGALQNGDKYIYIDESENTDKTWFIQYTIIKDEDGITVLEAKLFENYINDKFSSTTTSYPTINTSFKLNVYADELYDDVQIIDNSWNTYKNKFQITESNGNMIEVGDYIVAKTNDEDGNAHYMLTKVITKQKKFENGQFVFEYTVNQSINIITESSNKFITRYKPLESFVKTYQLFNLDGFKLTDYHLPGGPNKKSQLWKILGMLDPVNSNLLETLKDRNVITFRYVVDTFDGGLDPMTGPKSWITRLAKERQKCLAIMNAPSMKEFADSNNPRFTELPTPEDPKPILNTAYIADGANLTLGPDYTFSLPDEFWGSKFSGYFTPYLIMRENGRNFDVPPAAWVSNLYVQKHTSGYPWAIVAGARRGVLSDPKLVGLEYDFLLKDRENLEPIGLNPIIKKKGVGYMIFANAMAYQKTHSAFNNLHVRDLLITIEETIEDILGHFLFEFNDSSTRLQIKTMVDSYLDNVRTQGGIYDYICIMDETNNTPDIIDQNVGIIDVAIEPARGLQKFISRITVMKTGGVSGGGFTVS